MYSSLGTLSYNRDLGSRNNGWLYNGSAAPQTFSTTINSTSLTSSSSASSVASVAATVVLNNSNYTTLTINTTVTNALQDFSLCKNVTGLDYSSIIVNASPYTTTYGNSVDINSPSGLSGTITAFLGLRSCTQQASNTIAICQRKSASQFFNCRFAKRHLFLRFFLW